MSHDNKNAPAYPVQHDDRGHILSHEEGLSKRELFAAMAMQGILGGLACELNDLATPENWSATTLGKTAVLCADGLLNALAPEPEGKSTDGK